MAPLLFRSQTIRTVRCAASKVRIRSCCLVIASRCAATMDVPSTWTALFASIWARSTRVKAIAPIMPMMQITSISSRVLNPAAALPQCDLRCWRA